MFFNIVALCGSRSAVRGSRERAPVRRGSRGGAEPSGGPKALRLSFEPLEQRALLSVSVGTDRPDYAPGETAVITGAGFVPGDAIQLQVKHTDGNPDVSPANDPWTVATDASGDIQSTWYVDPGSSAGASLQLTAIDLTTGDMATADFTDTPSSVHVNSATGASSAPEGTAFTLYVLGTGFNSTAQVTWTPPGGSARTLTRLSQTSTQLTATVLSTDLPNEGTAQVRVTQTGGTGAGGPISFTITEGDSFTLSPVNVGVSWVGSSTTFSGTVATMTDTYDNTTPSEFTTSINWGDGSTGTGTVTRTTPNNYTIAGTHNYTAPYFQTTVRTTATALPAATIPIANNSITNSLPSQGTVVILTSAGYQTVNYTGKITGASAALTGCTGGTGTAAVGATVVEYFSPVSVTVTEPSPGTATGSTTSPLSVTDGITYSPAAGGFSVNEGATYTGSSPFLPGSIGTSVFPTVGYYQMLASNGTSSAWYSLYTSGPNNYMYPNSTTGSLVFGDEGPTQFTETTYHSDGTVACSASGTVTVNDAPLNSYFNGPFNGTAVVGVPSSIQNVGEFPDGYSGDHHSDFTATINWGDTTSSTGTVSYIGPSGSNSLYYVSGSHTYAASGTYHVTYSVVDDGGSKLGVPTPISTSTWTVSPDATTTGVTSSSALNTSTYGDSVTFTATVTNTSAGTAPSGGVEFYDGTTHLGPGTPGSSTGNQTTWTYATSSLGAGSHTINAFFTDGVVFASSNGTVTQTVNKAQLTVTAINQAMLAGTVPSLTTPTISGRVNGDTALSVYTGNPTATTTATSHSPVGDYQIIAAQGSLALTTAGATNYTLNFVPGWLTVFDVRFTFGSHGASYSIVNLGRDLPWFQINGIELVFGTQVSGSASVAVTNLGTNSTVFSSPVTVGAGMAVPWQFSTPLTLGTYQAKFSGANLHNTAHATDLAINALLNGLTENASVLPGDVNGDGFVSASDMVLDNNARVAPYDIFMDVDGSGVVDMVDVMAVRSRIGTQLL